jgi:hypothetical protein
MRCLECNAPLESDDLSERGIAKNVANYSIFIPRLMPFKPLEIAGLFAKTSNNISTFYSGKSQTSRDPSREPTYQESLLWAASLGARLKKLEKKDLPR